MATAIRDLFVSVTTKVDSGGLASLDKKLEASKDKFGKFAAFIAGGFIAKGVASFVQGQLDFADALSKSSQKLGIATDELERFGFMAELNGPSAELLYAGLNKMNKAIGDNAKGFSELGVSLKNTDGSARGTSEVFQDVLGKFGGLETQGEKTRLAMELFGKSGTELLPMLTQGADETARLTQRFEELGGATPQEFLDYSVKIKDAMTEFSLATLGAKQGVVMLLMPSLLKIIKTFSDVVAKTVNFEKRTKLLSTGIKLLASMFAMLKLASLAGNLMKVGRAAMTLKTIFGGFKSVLMSGGLMLAALLIQDLITFATGGKSAIGDFMDAFIGPEKAQEFAQQMRDVWTKVEGVLKDGVSVALVSVAGALPGILTGFVQLTDAIMRTFNALLGVAGMLKNVASIDADYWSNKDGAKDRINAGISAAGKKLDGVMDDTNFGGVAGTKAFQADGFMQPSTAPVIPSIPSWQAAPMAGSIPLSRTELGAGGKGVVTNTISQINNNTFEIKTDDPSGVAAAVKNAAPDMAKKQLRDAKGALTSQGSK